MAFFYEMLPFGLPSKTRAKFFCERISIPNLCKMYWNSYWVYHCYYLFDIKTIFFCKYFYYSLNNNVYGLVPSICQSKRIHQHSTTGDWIIWRIWSVKSLLFYYSLCA